MTSRELLRLMLKRWYVILLGGAITLAVIWPVVHRPGVYWTQFSVMLLPPTYEYFPNQLENPQYSLAALAGVIVTDLNGQHQPLLTASSDTTLFGEGQRSGTQVRLPNQGNQWTPLYLSSSIDVQVVDSDPETVELKAQQTTAELSDLLSKRQDALGVMSTMKATMIASPTDPSVYYISGSRFRAAGAVGFVGMLLTIAPVYWLERWQVRRRSKATSRATNARRELTASGGPVRSGRLGP